VFRSVLSVTPGGSTVRFLTSRIALSRNAELPVASATM
jgi:hypothetical protein